MPTRRMVGTVTVVTAGLLALAIGLTANGQDRPTSAPQYYQGRLSPSAPTYPGTAVPVKGAPGQAVPNVKSNTPQYPGLNGGKPVVPPPRPRFTQPVVAGPNGVRPVSASDPIPPTFNVNGGAPKSPATQLPLPPATLPTSGSPANVPAATTDGTPAIPPVNPLPEPLPLPGTTNPAPPAAPTIPSVPSIPMTLPQVPATSSGMPEQKEEPTPKPSVVRETEGKQPAPVQDALPVVDTTTRSSVDGPPLPARQSPHIDVETICPDAISVNQPLTYELVIRNVGTAIAQDFRIVEELPARSVFVSSEPSAETSGERLTWSLGRLEPGIEKRIKITIRPTEEGEICNRATFSFSSAVESRVKVTRPKLTVAVVTPDSIRIGEKVPVQIKLSNTGTGPANKVVLRLQFSEGLSHPQGQIIEAELPGLPADQTRTLNLDNVVSQLAGNQTCSLTAHADGNGPETAQASIAVVEPLLQLRQNGPTRCLVKGEPQYTIELRNPGSAATDPIELWSVLPNGFEFVQASDNGTFTESNRTIGWRLPSLAAGATKTIALKLRAIAPADGAIRTMARSGSDPIQQAGGTNVEVRSTARPLEARCETAIQSEGVPAIRFNVIDVEDPIVVGKEAVYEIKLVNQGTGPCTNVMIVAELSEGTAVAGVTGPTNSRTTGQQIVFDSIPSLDVKGEATYRVRVKGLTDGDHRFRVRIVSDQIRTPVIKEENTRFYKES